MLRPHGVSRRVLITLATCLAAIQYSPAQDSRGSILGKVTDPQAAVVPGATVVVTNTNTNVARNATTNTTGYYEVSFLDPGQYKVEIDAQGFKKVVRGPITLSVGDRLTVDAQLQIGEATQAIEVTADAPLLETASAAQGRVLNSRDVAQLPVGNMNPMLVQAMAAGMVFTGSLQPDNNRALDHASAANYASGGLGTGTNEFLLDGNPVTGTNGGRAGYVPTTDAVDEVRIETAPFDASTGHAITAQVMMTTKSGTNAIHGDGFWQMQQLRWNATPHFSRLAYQSGLASGAIAPGSPEQSSGKISQPGFSLGGPVYIPHILNGKNKLFFFVSYSKLTSIAAPQSGGNTPLYTVPTDAERNGDFSALLKVPTNPSQYIVYDPRTATLTGGHVVRTPFPNNVLPASVMTNPVTKFWSQLFPEPNNPVGLVNPDGTNNYYDGSQPNNDWFPDFLNRIDYNINQRNHLFGKWYFNHRLSDQYDWAHTTPLKGVMSNGLYRPTEGGSVDYTFTVNSSNVLDITGSFSQYSEGDQKPVLYNYSAAKVGLPGYIDQKAGSADSMPWMNIAGVANAVSTSFIGQPGLNQRGTTEQLSARMVTIRGNHTMKYGWEGRLYHYAAVNPLGNVTGYYQFSNNWDKQADNTASNQTTTTGLGWAAFLMGMPNSITLDTNDVPYSSTPYHALFFQDDFRLTSRLRLGFGLRFEHEGGTTERFNRGLAGGYDYSFVPPYASAVQNQYASILADPANANNAAVAILKQAMPASQFVVAGGVTYLGQKYNSLTDGTNRLLPNVSIVYQINPKTVLRMGGGAFAASFNAMGGTGNRPNAIGYNQTTSTIISPDGLGATFCCGVGNAANMGASNPMMDPFPTLASGSRFVLPLGNSMGSNILDGQGFSYLPRNFAPALSGRYSAGIQRELPGNQMVEVSYFGGYSTVPFTQNQSYLPAQYWNFFDQRSSTVDTLMQTTVPNPFKGSLAAIQSSNVPLYNYLSTIGIFSSNTLQLQQLLRAYPNAGFGLQQQNAMRGKVVDNEIHVRYEKRLSHGVQSNVEYSHMWGRQQWLANQFDQTPEWQLNPNIRPNRLVWSTVWELPFGKGRQWLTQGPLQHVLGGWQLSWIYTYQTGALISWGNNYYYGSVDQIASALNTDIHSQNIHMWYNPAVVWTGTGAPPSDFVGFEGRTANQPNTYQARVFPQYINGLTSDPIRNWDVKVLRRFRLYERLSLVVAVDMLNMTNHTQFAAPSINLTNGTFGQLTGQANWPRILQFNTRVEF